MEGGSKRRIEEEWDLHDVSAQHDHWRVFGPPTHIGVAAIAAGLGLALTRDTEETAEDGSEELPVLGGPSIAELARLAPAPVAGADTIAASRAVLEALMKGQQ